MIISGLYYFNNIYYESDDLLLNHDVSIEYSELDENSIDVTFTDINKKNTTNVMIIYKKENVNINNGTIVKENIRSGDVVTIDELNCNKFIYIVNKENDTMNILESFDIPCENDNEN